MPCSLRWPRPHRRGAAAVAGPIADESGKPVYVHAFPLANELRLSLLVLVTSQPRVDIVTAASDEADVEMDAPDTKEQLVVTLEELSAANEELRTAEEQLKESNRQLALHARQQAEDNAQMRASRDELRNVAGSYKVPLIMTDESGTVRLASPAAARMLHVQPTDVGRPLSELAISRQIPDLDHLVAEVASGRTVATREVATDSGGAYLLDVVP